MPKKTWDKVLMGDRMELGMDSADPRNRSEWQGRNDCSRHLGNMLTCIHRRSCASSVRF